MNIFSKDWDWSDNLPILIDSLGVLGGLEVLGVVIWYFMSKYK